MSTSRWRWIAIFALWSSLIPFDCCLVTAQENLQKQDADLQNQSTSKQVDPQIVRIRYLEGDVRVARGRQVEKNTGAVWEVAESGLPLSTGYSLVTGDGRVEIEFEDASTVYLAENSALTFNDIHTRGGVPYTLMALLSGAATLYVKPQYTQEVFTLKTPTGEVSAHYPNMTYVRVVSYANGYSLTFQQSTTIHMPGKPWTDHYQAGQTLIDHGNGVVSLADSHQSDPLAEWDRWVAKRTATLNQSQTEMLKASGLSQPIPGLADLAGKGKFFSCAPYGTCWEPNGAIQELQRSDASDDVTAAPDVKIPDELAALLIHHDARILNTEYFPCGPDLTQSMIQRKVALQDKKQRNQAKGSEKKPQNAEWPLEAMWAMCHSGTWTYRQQHYVWVVGTNLHSKLPYHWMKWGHEHLYVPILLGGVGGPLPGKPIQHAFLVDERNLTIGSVRLDPHSKYKLLDVTPKELQRMELMPLARSTEPHVEVHWVSSPAGAFTRAGDPVLAYNEKKQNFQIAHQITVDDKIEIVREPYSGIRGDLQARVKGVDAHGNYEVRRVTGSVGRADSESFAATGNGGGSGSYSPIGNREGGGNAGDGSRGRSGSSGSQGGGGNSSGSHNGSEGYSGGGSHNSSGGGYSGGSPSGSGGSHSGGGGYGGGGGYSGGGGSSSGSASLPSGGVGRH